MKETESVLMLPKKVLTPVARATYCYLLEPSEYKNKKDYKITLLFDKNADLSNLKRAALTAAKERFGNRLPDLSKTFRSGDQKIRESDGSVGDEFKGVTFINPKSKNKPDVGMKISGKWIDILDPKELYWGMYVRATVTAFAYDTEGNRGVSFSLNNVLKIRDGESLGGWSSGEEDFASCGDSDIDYSGGSSPDTGDDSLWGKNSGKQSNDDEDFDSIF